MANRALPVTDGQGSSQALFDVGAPFVNGVLEVLLPG